MPKDADDTNRQTKAAFLAMRDEWIDYVNQCHDLSHAAARVGTFIALRMSAKEQRSWWPVKKIAKVMGCSTSTVSAAISQLVGAHVLVVTRANRRSNQSYQIRMPYGE